MIFFYACIGLTLAGLFLAAVKGILWIMGKDAHRAIRF